MALSKAEKRALQGFVNCHRGLVKLSSSEFEYQYLMAKRDAFQSVLLFAPHGIYMRLLDLQIGRPLRFLP